MSRLTKTKRTVIPCVGLLLLLSLLSCCNGKEKPGASSRFTIGVGRDLYFGPSSPIFLHGSLNVWEGLTGLDHRLEVRPLLAVNWEAQKDGRLWVFHLRKDVSFHDGEPLNAEVVVKNIERMRNPRFDLYGVYRNVKSVAVVDQFSVSFLLHTPDPVFPSRLSYFGSPMFSLKSFDYKGNIKEPLGTGPFMLKGHRKGESITLVRNERYYLGIPMLKEIVYKYIPNPSTRVSALKAGEIDAIVDIGGILPEQVPLLDRDGDIEIFKQEVATTHYLLFNTRRLPFSSQGLRQAVSRTVDREEMVQTIFGGYALPAREFFSPLAQVWMSKATKLFEGSAIAERPTENTSKHSQKVILVVNAGLAKRWPYRPVSEVIQAHLRDIGINAEINMLEMGAWKDALKRGNFDISLCPYTLMTGDPDFFFSWWMHSKGQLNVDRGIGYQNPVADDLIEEARSEMNPERRKETYDQLQEIIARDLPLTPLFHDVAIYACKKRVQGLRLDAFFRPCLGETWIKIH